MNTTATATLTNLTGMRKNLSQIGVVVGPGETVEVRVADVMGFVNRPDWEVCIPPGGCEFRDGDRLSLYFCAPFGVTDGYGNYAEEILIFLDRAHVKLSARHLWQLNPTGLQKRTLELLQAPMETAHAVGICMATPGEFNRLPTPYRIGLTMYESSDYRTVHPEWTHQINEMDMLLTFGVGEEWNVGLFQRCGVRIPIKPVRGSGNWHFYRPEARRQVSESDTFTVVSWGMMHKRKSPLEMVEVFKRAFPRRKYPHCRFRIKTVGGVIGDLPYGSYRPDDPRVEVISADWLPDRMVEFGKSGDVMLYLAHGEGCGRPPREAMAMGLPLICANNSGMLPICDGRFMTPVHTHHWEAAPIGGQWAVPDWDQAVDALRWHHDHREEAQAKARNGADWIARFHSPQMTAHDIMVAIRGVDPAQSKSVNGRGWVDDYLPDTDHTPASRMLWDYTRPPASVVVFGPHRLLRLLQEMGYNARPGPGGPVEIPVSDRVDIRRIQAVLELAPLVLLAVPGDYYPVRPHGTERLMDFNHWARLLEEADLNVVGTKAYGGDYGRDFNVFLLSSATKKRGVLVR